MFSLEGSRRFFEYASIVFALLASVFIVVGSLIKAEHETKFALITAGGFGFVFSALSLAVMVSIRDSRWVRHQLQIY